MSYMRKGVVAAHGEHVSAVAFDVPGRGGLRADVLHRRSRRLDEPTARDVDPEAVAARVPHSGILSGEEIRPPVAVRVERYRRATTAPWIGDTELLEQRRVLGIELDAADE